MLTAKSSPAAALVVMALAVAGCSGDDTQDPSGSGGAGATAGDTGSGGNGNTGGSGNAGGSGGAGNAGGSGGSGNAGGSGGAGNAGGSAGLGGSSGSAGANSGGTGGTVGGCNYLTLLGQPVTAAITATLPPAAQGGAISEGFYNLVSVTLYGGASGGTFQRTLRFVGNELKSVEQDGNATSARTTAGTYAISGVELQRSITCPATSSAAFDYTATATTFTAYESQGGNAVVALEYEWVSL